MLRQLLAIFAFLTGFAALCGPAQAAVASSADVAVQRSSESESGTKTADTICAKRQAAQRRRGEKVAPCPTGPVVIFIPNVHLGPDRALE